MFLRPCVSGHHQSFHILESGNKVSGSLCLAEDGTVGDSFCEVCFQQVHPRAEPPLPLRVQFALTTRCGAARILSGPCLLWRRELRPSKDRPLVQGPWEGLRPEP